MKGICFIEEMFDLVIQGTKTQTRRIANGKPRYNVGDLVYLKEPYMFVGEHEGYILYKYDKHNIKKTRIWQNKLFMPNKYSRFFIIIENVSTEHLQDITVADCQKEGIISGNDDDSIIKKYAELINQINGNGTWESNPLVHVYNFSCRKQFDYLKYNL
jgi:hypothetical protein